MFLAVASLIKFPVVVTPFPPVLSMTHAAGGSEKSASFERTWGSSASSGYCSDEESDSEFEQYFTARTSFFPKTRADAGNVGARVKQVSRQTKLT